MTMYTKRPCFVLLIWLTFFITEKAWPQDAIFSQFYASSLYLNPAFAGTGEGTRLIMNYRHHPMPDARGFATVYGSLDAYIPTLSGGLAIVATTDNQGELLARSHIAGVYSYHLQVREDLFVNFGLQAGYLRQDIRWDKLEFTNPGQEPPENTLKHGANFAFGMMLYNDWMYGGAALHHITRPQISLFSDDRLDMKYTAHLGIILEPPKNSRVNTASFDYILSPNLIYQKQGQKQRINLGLYGGIESFLAGVWYRHNIEDRNAVIFLLGFSASNFRIGYSYDHSLSGYTDLLYAAHEISVSLNFLTSDQKRRQNILKCPLY